jgi:hypothetical protein
MRRGGGERERERDVITSIDHQTWRGKNVQVSNSFYIKQRHLSSYFQPGLGSGIEDLRHLLGERLRTFL